MNLASILQNDAATLALPAGSVLFSRGERGDAMLVIIEGEVEILVGDKVIDTSGPGSIVGEMALLDESTRSATVRARTDCRVVPIDKERFLTLIQQTPLFAFEVMHVMADRLRRLHTLVD